MMTAEIQCSMSLNLFEPNDELMMRPPAGVLHGPAPAALTVLCPVVQDMASSRLACLQHACDMIERECLSHDIWLLLIHTAWRRDTRLNRYKKLWKSFGADVQTLPSERPAEEMLESPEGVKFYASVRVQRAELVKVIDLLMSKPGSLVLAVPSGQSLPLQELLAAGWGHGDYDTLVYWRDLAAVTMRHEGILFRPFGAFDDREAGFDLIATPEMVRRIASAVD